MDLDVFSYIDQTLELYESKKDIYKLIADEIKEFFETEVFDKSKYTLNMVYRVKSPESIREKLIKNNYFGRYPNIEDILPNIQDILGLRIECKFIDDEHYVYGLLKELFLYTEDQEYYNCLNMPKIKLKLSESQPQKQKNGFDIYKIDGLYLLGKEYVRFELQIKALVNLFWGEIEHKIIYKNNSYLMVDSYIYDLMNSVKKSLNMIDSQLHVLYKRFKRADDEQSENQLDSIKKLLSKMVYDTFAEKLKEQIGFTINFKASCDEIIEYLIYINHAADFEEYGRAMISVFQRLSQVKEENIRVDTQIELGGEIQFEDPFLKSVAQTVCRLINIDFNWHLFFLILFSMDDGNRCEEVESYVLYYKNQIFDEEIFKPLFGNKIPGAHEIRRDIMHSVARVFGEKGKIELLCGEGIILIKKAVLSVIYEVVKDHQAGKLEYESDPKRYLSPINEGLKDI